MKVIVLLSSLALLKNAYTSHKFSILSSKIDKLTNYNHEMYLNTNPDRIKMKLLSSIRKIKEIQETDKYELTLIGIEIYKIRIIDNTLYISKKHEEEYSLSEDNYQLLNQIISVRGITQIEFSNLEEKFDFSQIDFANIKRITLDNCQTDISKLDLSNTKTLEFNRCSMDLSDLDLTHIENLSITESSGDLSKVDLSNIKILLINNCNGALNICNESLSNVQDLTLINCSDLQHPSLSNLKSLNVQDCDDSIDFSKFSGEFEEIVLKNVSPSKLKKFFLQGDFSGTRVTFNEELTKESNLKELLEILEKNQISLEQIKIIQKNAGNYTGLTEEEFVLLGNLNVKYINLDVEGFEKPINIYGTLNDSIQNIYITAVKEKEEYLENGEKIIQENSELGSLNIKSNNKNLNLYLSNINITSNTHLSLPDQTKISFNSLDCTDIRPFKDLRNVKYIWFKEDIKGAEPNAFQNGAAVYTTDLDFIACYCEKYTYDYPAPHDDTFKDFDLFLEYLEKSYRLEILRNKLNILEESKKIKDVFDIEGYPVHLGSFGTITESTKVYKDIYSLNKKENSVNSYYGSSKTRCIRSFVMSNGENPIEVYNTDAYYSLKEMGYELIGYNVVNYDEQNPITEFYCQDEDLKRVFTPFDKY